LESSGIRPSVTPAGFLTFSTSDHLDGFVAPINSARRQPSPVLLAMID
jgi:hypothetical protein